MDNHKVRFAGVIDKMGNLLAGGFKQNIDSLIPDKESRIFFTQQALKHAMARDFDETLGKIEYIATRRQNVFMLTIPLGDKIILVSAERDSEEKSIIKSALKEFHIR